MSGKSVKDLFSQTTIYGVGLLANKAISFVLLPLYTFYFSPSELGAYNIVQSLWMFIILFYLYGQETSFIKFFIDGHGDSEKKEIYSTTLILLTVSSFVFSLILYFLSGSITSVLEFEDPVKGLLYIRILSMVLFTDALFRFPLLLLRAELKAMQYLVLTILSLIVNVSLNFILIMECKLGVEAIFYSYIVSVVITFIAGLLVTKKYLSAIFSFEIARQLIGYGLKFILVGVFILLIDVSDRFFLKYIYSEELVGIYSANYRLASVMSLLIAAFRFSWTPYFLNLEKNPENKKIVSGIFTYIVFIGMFLFLFFALFTEPVVKISFGKFSLLDTRYQSGLVIIPFVLIAYVFSGLYSALSVAPFYADKTKELLYISGLGLIVNTVLNYLLILNYGMIGASVSTLLTYFVMMVVLYYRAQKIYRIEYEIKKILLIFILAISLFIISYFTKEFLSEINFIFLSIVLIFIFLAPFKYFKPKK